MASICGHEVKIERDMELVERSLVHWRPSSYPLGVGVLPVVQLVESSDDLQAADDGQVVGDAVGSGQGPLLAHDHSSAEVLAGIGTHHPLQGDHEGGGVGHGRGTSHDPVVDVIWGVSQGYFGNKLNCT